MLRQAIRRITPLVSRSNYARSYCCGKPPPLCEHHKDLVPPFCEICKLKGFELKSDCTTFHMKSQGYEPVCCPPPCPPKPCPPKPCP
ncbi:CLUMA_CG017447, isoform A [Clunio marinus]|uniref:CLUMA_CG017447, isoform A n=1 Tax=Clunio marinus TaxID=568069 RepID=A0A1J1IXB9_9DIPT|nr:CLUMA_CG017447, isoform A [Clunio marinus]